MTEHGTAEVAAGPQGPAAHTFDMFVVHAVTDAAFVRGYLLPALDLPAERVLLIDELTPGALTISEIERGISTSRFTVVVLSGACDEDRWAVFAEQLASHHSLHEAHIIPLRLDAHSLPLRLDARVALDFTDRSRWDPEVSRLRAMLNLAPPVDAVIACPYPGMRPFAAGEAGLFFGRDRELGELITRLDRQEREIYVIGPSGSGKSSLVQAGLLPRLNTGSSRLGRAFVVRAMRPGGRPLERLVSALGGNPALPAATLDALLGRHRPADRVLVFVDQLEELFTLADAPERQRFFAALGAMRAEPRFHVLLALRADFYGALMDSELWPDDGALSRLDIGPLRGRSLEQAIVEPAMQRGVYLEPRLCDRLVTEAASEPGALPLVQETLRILWDCRRRRLLGLAEYEALGNGGSALHVAIAHHADAAMRTLSPVQQTMAHRVLLRLVSFGEGRPDTRRQQKLQALRSATDDDGECARVVQKLVEHRLLTIDRGEQADAALVDLAHEALISAWPALQRQIAQRKADEQQRRRLEAKVEEWIERGRGTASLLDPVELVEAERWMASEAARELGYGDRLPELVAASRNAIEQIEQEARKVSRIVGTAYLERGTALLEDGEPLQALPYLVAARAEGQDSSRLRTLFAQAARHLPAIVLRGHDASISRIAFSPDGTRLVTASSDRTARIWDVSTAAPVTPPLEHLGAVTAVAFSRDGKCVATGSEDKTARVWDAATGVPVTPPLSRRGTITAVAFSSDGRRVLAASVDRTVRVWDATTGVAIGPPLVHSRAVLAAAFGPDEARVVTCSDDGIASVWNPMTGEPVPPLIVGNGRIHTAAFSPDGSRLAIASKQLMRIWDTATRKQRASTSSKHLEHAATVLGLTFDRSGTRLASTSRDGTIQVWDAITGKPLASALTEAGSTVETPCSLGVNLLVIASLNQAVIRDVSTGAPVRACRHSGAILDLTLSPDDAFAATAGDDGLVRIWETAPHVVALGPPWVRATAAVFSPDGTRIATTSSDGTARIWNAASGEPATPPLRHKGPVTTAVFSRDGAYLFAAGERDARAWSVVTGDLARPAFKDLDDVTWMMLSPDGSRLVTAGADYRARVEHRVEHPDRQASHPGASSSRPGQLGGVQPRRSTGRDRGRRRRRVDLGCRDRGAGHPCDDASGPRHRRELQPLRDVRGHRQR